MSLTELAIRAAKAQAKPYKVYDAAWLLTRSTPAPNASREIRADRNVHSIAEEWLQTKEATLTESTWQRDRDQLVKLVGPYLGNPQRLS